MTDHIQAGQPVISGLLARFITDPVWLHPDHSIRADAFIPPRDLNLSLTSHAGISEEKLWELGADVAKRLSLSRSARSRLMGRGDISREDVKKQSLVVLPCPLPENPNHVHVCGWPEKPHQKRIAQELAKAAKFVASPVVWPI